MSYLLVPIDVFCETEISIEKTNVDSKDNRIAVRLFVFTARRSHGVTTAPLYHRSTCTPPQSKPSAPYTPQQELVSYRRSDSSLPLCTPRQRMLRKMTILPEITVIYVGNRSGDIVAAHLSLAELATLSGDSKGPVPCQRRTNHNPYRAVRVELTPQASQMSLQAACRAQRQAAVGGGAGGRHYRMPRYSRVSSCPFGSTVAPTKWKRCCDINMIV